MKLSQRERAMNILDLITNLRGGTPERCDFCGQEKADLQPEEAGDWACLDCLQKWRETGQRDQSG